MTISNTIFLTLAVLVWVPWLPGEIAASLNLSERAIKFHVSSLLTKFQVRGRMELAHKAGSMPTYLPVPTRETPSYAQVPQSYGNPPGADDVVSLAKQQLI